MPAPKHCNREMEAKVGSDGRKGADKHTHVERLRTLNGFSALEHVPQSVPGPDANFRELWRGERDPRRWLASGGGAAPGHAFDGDLQTKRRHAYEAYLRSTGASSISCTRSASATTTATLWPRARACASSAQLTHTGHTRR